MTWRATAKSGAPAYGTVAVQRGSIVKTIPADQAFPSVEAPAVEGVLAGALPWGLVLTGAADCGSCTAYSVHDAIELESRGRPTIVLTTALFPNQRAS